MSRPLLLHVTAPEVTVEPLWESRLGHIVGTDGKGRPVVDFDCNPVGRRVARKAVRLDAEGIQAAVNARHAVELRFEEGDPRLPIITALLPGAPSDVHSNALRAALEKATESRARVIQGEDGLALRCGEASVTLLRNGKVSVRGTCVEASSEGTLRLKSMSLQVHAPGAQIASAGEEETRPLDAGGLLPEEDAADVQVLQGQERLTLRCGRASLTLLRSGRILLEGTYVETRAEGVIRLQGGSVQVN